MNQFQAFARGYALGNLANARINHQLLCSSGDDVGLKLSGPVLPAPDKPDKKGGRSPTSEVSRMIAGRIFEIKPHYRTNRIRYGFTHSMTAP
jgi:hypothetical protein